MAFTEDVADGLTKGVVSAMRAVGYEPYSPGGSEAVQANSAASEHELAEALVEEYEDLEKEARGLAEACDGDGTDAILADLEEQKKIAGEVADHFEGRAESTHQLTTGWQEDMRSFFEMMTIFIISIALDYIFLKLLSARAAIFSDGIITNRVNGFLANAFRHANKTSRGIADWCIEAQKSNDYLKKTAAYLADVGVRSLKPFMAATMSTPLVYVASGQKMTVENFLKDSVLNLVAVPAGVMADDVVSPLLEKSGLRSKITGEPKEIFMGTKKILEGDKVEQLLRETFSSDAVETLKRQFVSNTGVVIDEASDVTKASARTAESGVVDSGADARVGAGVGHGGGGSSTGVSSGSAGSGLDDVYPLRSPDGVSGFGDRVEKDLRQLDELLKAYNEKGIEVTQLVDELSKGAKELRIFAPDLSPRSSLDTRSVLGEDGLVTSDITSKAARAAHNRAEELAGLETVLEREQTRRDVLKNEIGNLKSEREAHGTARQWFDTAHLGAKQSELMVQERTVRKLEAEIAAKQTELSHANNVVSGINNNATFKNRIVELRQEMDGIKKQIHDGLGGVSDRVTTFQAAAKEGLEEAGTRVKNAEEALKDPRAKTAEARTKFEDAQKQTVEREAKVTEGQKRLQEARTRRDAAEPDSGDFAAASDEVSSVRRELNSAQEELRNAKSAEAEALKKLERQQGVLNVAEDALTDANNTYAKAQKTLEQASQCVKDVQRFNAADYGIARAFSRDETGHLLYRDSTWRESFYHDVVKGAIVGTMFSIPTEFARMALYDDSEFRWDSVFVNAGVFSGREFMANRTGRGHAVLNENRNPDGLLQKPYDREVSTRTEAERAAQGRDHWAMSPDKMRKDAGEGSVKPGEKLEDPTDKVETQKRFVRGMARYMLSRRYIPEAFSEKLPLIGGREIPLVGGKSVLLPHPPGIPAAHVHEAAHAPEAARTASRVLEDTWWRTFAGSLQKIFYPIHPTPEPPVQDQVVDQYSDDNSVYAAEPSQPAQPTQPVPGQEMPQQPGGDDSGSREQGQSDSDSGDRWNSGDDSSAGSGDDDSDSDSGLSRRNSPFSTAPWGQPQPQDQLGQPTEPGQPPLSPDQRLDPFGEVPAMGDQVVPNPDVPRDGTTPVPMPNAGQSPSTGDQQDGSVSQAGFTDGPTNNASDGVYWNSPSQQGRPDLRDPNGPYQPPNPPQRAQDGSTVEDGQQLDQNGQRLPTSGFVGAPQRFMNDVLGREGQAPDHPASTYNPLVPGEMREHNQQFGELLPPGTPSTPDPAQRPSIQDRLGGEQAIASGSGGQPDARGNGGYMPPVIPPVSPPGGGPGPAPTQSAGAGAGPAGPPPPAGMGMPPRPSSGAGMGGMMQQQQRPPSPYDVIKAGGPEFHRHLDEFQAGSELWLNEILLESQDEVSSVLDDYQMDPTQWHILDYLQEHPEASPDELKEELSAHDHELSSAMEVLQDRGWVTDEGESDETALSITDDGREHRDLVDQRVSMMLWPMIDEIPEDERDTLAAMFDLLAHREELRSESERSDDEGGAAAA